MHWLKQVLFMLSIPDSLYFNFEFLKKMRLTLYQVTGLSRVQLLIGSLFQGIQKVVRDGNDRHNN